MRADTRDRDRIEAGPRGYGREYSSRDYNDRDADRRGYHDRRDGGRSSGRDRDCEALEHMERDLEVAQLRDTVRRMGASLADLKKDVDALVGALADRFDAADDRLDALDRDFDTLLDGLADSGIFPLSAEPEEDEPDTDSVESEGHDETADDGGSDVDVYEWQDYLAARPSDMF